MLQNVLLLESLSNFWSLAVPDSHAFRGMFLLCPFAQFAHIFHVLRQMVSHISKIMPKFDYMPELHSTSSNISQKSGNAHRSSDFVGYGLFRGID